MNNLEIKITTLLGLFMLSPLTMSADEFSFPLETILLMSYYIFNTLFKLYIIVPHYDNYIKQVI